MIGLRLKLDAGQRIVEVTEDRIVLGRDASAQVVVKDRSVSRTHAVIERRGDLWFVVDQGSSNGTFLNGRRITEEPLVNGQELRLGMVALHVEVEAPPAEATVMMNLSAGPREMATVLMTPAATRRGSAPAPEPPALQQAALDRAVAEERLGVTPGASPDQVRQRYEQLDGKAQQRLAAASSEQVKAHCQRQIDELRAAHDALCGSPAPSPPGAPSFDPRDLPSAQPVVAEDALASVFVQSSSPAVMAHENSPDVGMHPMTRVFGSVAIVLVALALFFAIGTSKYREQIGKLQQTPEYTKARGEYETYRSTATLVAASALVNRRLAICNVGTQAQRVSWLAAVHVEVSNQDPKDPSSARIYRTPRFHSGYCGSAFDVVVEPGATRTLSFAGANERCQWQGAAAFFALSTIRASKSENAQTTWHAGVPGGEGACLKIGAGQ